MAYIILFLRRCQTIPANPPPRSINVESAGACVVEVVKAASAIVIDKNADAKMVLAKKSFFIYYLVPRTHADYKSGHFPAAEEAECRLIKSPHLDQYHRRSNNLLRRMVNNRNRTGAPAFAIPLNRLVQMNPEWIHSFQVVFLSALRTGDRFHHGVTSYDL
jgi:hypothetical protein